MIRGRLHSPPWSRIGHERVTTGPNRSSRRGCPRTRKPLFTWTDAHGPSQAVIGVAQFESLGAHVSDVQLSRATTRGPTGPMSPLPISSMSTWCCARATTRVACRPCRLPVPIGAQPQRLTTLPLSRGPADRDGRVRRRCRDDPSVVDRGAVHADPRPRQRASRRDTASAHLVLRNPPRSTAGEHRSLRLGAD